MADPSTSSAPEVGRLQATFSEHPFENHGEQWDALWKDSYSPWDRGGPSLALNDLLLQHQELFPRRGRRLKALVPGCGRGHDVLLLSAFGYDVTGLDVSEAGLREAAENEKKSAGDEIFAVKEGVSEKGKVTWLAGDFFGASGTLKPGEFDLIFDYTVSSLIYVGLSPLTSQFFCALPSVARSKWAKRMSELLSPDGRLVCLEWPLAKPFGLNDGPPWGLTAEAYESHLTHPGVDLEYNPSGLVASSVPTTTTPGALRQLARIKPSRTHESGHDSSGNVIDFISIWSH